MEPALQVCDVSVHRGRRAVLRDVSLSVAAGEIVALIGPNGAGKTTLLEVIVGARRPDAGRVLAGGRRLESIADRAGVMAWAADAAEPAPECRVERLLDAPGRDALLGPLGLTQLRSARAGRLSRGERRRVVLAEALLQDRPVVVLDEPFAAFDALQLRTIAAELRRRADDGIAFIVSVHQLEQALRVADRVVLLHAGRVVATGTEAQLRTRAKIPSGSLEDVVVALLTGEGGDAT